MILGQCSFCDFPAKPSRYFTAQEWSGEESALPQTLHLSGSQLRLVANPLSRDDSILSPYFVQFASVQLHKARCRSGP